MTPQADAAHASRLPNHNADMRSRHRFGARTLVAVTVSLLMMTACAPTTREAAGLLGTTWEEPPLAGSSPEGTGDGPFYEGRDVSESRDGTPTEDRSASLFYNKMRVCISNLTSAELRVTWNSWMQNDTGDYLPASELDTTLSPDSSTCAVSYASGGTEEANVSLAGHPVTATNSGGSGFKLNLSGTQASLLPNRTLRQELAREGNSTFALEAETNGVLTTFNAVRAYPIDLRVSDPR